MKKGRHRRFEEARALKRSTELIEEPCPECGAEPDTEHATWCLAMEDDDEPEDGGLDGLSAGYADAGQARYADAGQPSDARGYADSGPYTPTYTESESRGA